MAKHYHIDTKRTFPSGILVHSAIINGERVSQRYIGYSITESKHKFKDYLELLESTRLRNESLGMLRHRVLKSYRSNAINGML